MFEKEFEFDLCVIHVCLLQYKQIKELQRKSHIRYFYEGTVGAGLPIISTSQSC